MSTTTDTRADHRTLLAALRRRVTLLETDLRERSDDPEVDWSANLRREYDGAVERERTALTWASWRDGEVAQAAVAWVLACTFVRFCEDNHLLAGHPTAGQDPLWIAGPGARTREAVENEQGHYERVPTALSTDWLRLAFDALGSLPAGKALLDRDHNLVYRMTVSEPAAKSLLEFWRASDESGALVHDFTDPTLDTRFLGDLYQDLSDYAKKTYALLQTPEFVEEFILDRTLTPAIAEFGVADLRLIDPTCGSGHFLLGAFRRIVDEIGAREPNTPVRVRVERALKAVHGVDLNPFAVAIARFRLTIAALRTAGDTTLTAAPEYHLNLAIGDSLLGASGTQNTLDLSGDGGDAYEYASEDLRQYHGILTHGRYHVVVGNPPYIVPKDPAASKAYRAAYPTCHRQYALSVPFMELFFRLAKRQGTDGGAGYVGQITANSFMKREFGRKVIEDFLSGRDADYPVDLTTVIDTSGAYIPGHGTPTVILIGRLRFAANHSTVRAALGVRGEPRQPVDPARGLVWEEIVQHVDDAAFSGSFISVSEMARSTFANHPWSLTGGEAPGLLAALETVGSSRLHERIESIGLLAVTRENEAYLVGKATLRRRRVDSRLQYPLVTGIEVRDWQLAVEDSALATYNSVGVATSDIEAKRLLWPLRELLWIRRALSGTQREIGREWWEYSQLSKVRWTASSLIVFPLVATHNHFSISRHTVVAVHSAPVIKLPEGASEDDHLALLAVLNSSTACFWLKQVSHNKGSTVDTKGARQTTVPWEDFYEFTGTKLQQFPLPKASLVAGGRALDTLAQELSATAPGRVLESESLSLGETISRARTSWNALRDRLVFEQEELDWETYFQYGLTDSSLTSGQPSAAVDSAPRSIKLGERAFEIKLARRVADGADGSAWFERHGSTPRTDLPEHWSSEYRALVERRLAEIETNPHIRLLERPEYKRRWATTPWEQQVTEALRSLALDRLESADLWRDGRGAATLSVAQLADRVRDDEVLAQALALLAGSAQHDAVATLTALLKDEAVPFAAALRLKDSAMSKFRDWQHVWALQRREDAGESVTIPVPPKYAPADFRSTAAWRARGKLDVPKERFIAYPGLTRAGDPSPVVGWAGWDHADQALALARALGDAQAQGASSDFVVPLLAGLAELEPWLHQWHADFDPARGGSPAQSITALLDHTLATLGLTRLDLEAWRPQAAARSRRPRTTPEA
ncbi:BREX-2 system adenine-specific DNA-methyltransferase PglX [Cellulomonas sp. HZM]|uniref:BREX-2 system adenine-specific DNA-methyltransferase PglX n=1 Tax=Cellulomonas sp. HZM TaxID=1454010 RepID=UPI000689A217|nr:BREX-2 system adenine-specific DNA-methyltransferase PglX [Cellulomonas sp. HZM]